MDIRELRINDIVFNTEENSNCVILGVDKMMGIDSIYAIYDECVYNYPKDYYEPITITEEILLKLGFKAEIEDIINRKFYILRLKGYCIDINEWSNTIGRDYGIHIDNLSCDSILGADIQYVHQLQNYIFDATGEELDVTELFK